MAETPFERRERSIETSYRKRRGYSLARARKAAKATAGIIARREGKAPGQRGYAAARARNRRIRANPRQKRRRAR